MWRIFLKKIFCGKLDMDTIFFYSGLHRYFLKGYYIKGGAYEERI